MYISVFKVFITGYFIAFRNVSLKNVPEGSGIRKVPEPSGTFPGMFIAFPCTFPSLKYYFIPKEYIPKECSGTFPHVHCILMFPQRMFRNPHIPHTHIPHKNLYFVTMTLFLTNIFLGRPVNWTRLVLLLSLRS